MYLKSALSFIILSFSWNAFSIVNREIYEQISEFIKNKEKVESLHLNMLQENYRKNKNSSFYDTLALGVRYSSVNPKLALQYLAIARHKSSEDELPINLYFQGKLHLEMGAYQSSVNIWHEMMTLDKARNKWQGLYKLADLALLETYYFLKQDERFLDLYLKVKKNLSKRERYSKIDMYAAKIYERKKNFNKLFEIAENLLIDYPLTGESIWAFSKLNEFTCDSKEGYRFYFSKKALLNLAVNFSLNNGIKEFILATLKTKIRISQDYLKKLDDLELIEMLIKLKFYPEAFREAKKTYENKQLSDNELKKILLTLGQLANRLKKYQLAMKYFSLYRDKFSQNKFDSTIKEFIADSLRYGGYQSSAASLYGLAAKGTNDMLLRWHHFWTTYSAKDFKQALLLLNINNSKYVPPRDQHMPEGPTYWLGRIYERTNQEKEAITLYRDLLSKTSDSVYSEFVLSRFPDLGKISPDHLSQNKYIEFKKEFKMLPKQISQLSNYSDHIVEDERLKMIINLVSVGLRDIAKILLDDIMLNSVKLANWPLLGQLALELKNYSLSNKLISAIYVQPRNRPVSWYDVRNHQVEYNDFWRIYYPLAFNEIVTVYSNLLEIDRYLIFSMMRTESNYNTNAVSWVGAKGLMQIMPYTAQKIATNISDPTFNIDNLQVPEVNIAYAAWYLKQLISYFDGHKVLAVAAYNAGPKAVYTWLERCKSCAVDEFIESIPYKETRNYVKEVFRNLSRYKRIYENSDEINLFDKGPFEVSAKRYQLF